MELFLYKHYLHFTTVILSDSPDCVLDRTHICSYDSFIIPHKASTLVHPPTSGSALRSQCLVI